MPAGSGWIPWPRQDRPETGPWYSWMPSEASWLARARERRQREVEEHAARDRRREASTGWR